MLEENIIRIIYKKLITNIFKNKIIIILIIMIESLQIFIEAMRLASLLNKSKIDENISDFYHLFKYLSVQTNLENLFKKKISDTDLLNQKIIVYKSYEYFILYILNALFFIVCILVMFFLKREYEYINNNSHTIFSDKNLTNNLDKYISNNDGSDNANNEDYAFNNKRAFFRNGIVEFFVFNYFELYFHVFGCFVFDVNLNIQFTSLKQIIDLNNYDVIIIFNFLLSSIFIILIIMVNLLYIRHFFVMINFDKELCLFKDNIFSRSYDYLILLLKIVIGIEKNLSNLKIENQYILGFFRVFFLLIILFFILKISHRYYNRKFLYLINPIFNQLRLFMIISILCIFLSYLILNYQFSLTSPQTYLNLISIILIAYLITKFLHLKSNNNLIDSNKYLIYQIAFVIDTLFTKNENSSKNSDFYFNLVINHKTNCFEPDCRINNLKSINFQSIIEVYIDEIKKYQLNKNFPKEYSNELISHRIYLVENNSLKHLIQIISNLFLRDSINENEVKTLPINDETSKKLKKKKIKKSNHSAIRFQTII